MDPKDEIKQRLDIVDLIGEYAQLKPGGSGRMKANCPFHSEKTPSFFVSRERQIWYCFGACNEGGDIFSFVMKMEGVDFPEALRQLADKAGVKIERFVSEDANKRARLLGLLGLAAKFFNKCLLESERAGIARGYTTERGLTDDLIQKFQLGYAFDEWDTLVTFLKKKGYREQEMIEAGLAVMRQDRSGIYDRFRHRLMFPITDVRGQPVGFGGRLLDETREEGKYINTPQTLVYNKSQILYGLSLAKQAIKQSGAVVIVEGNMDVIASHKAGVEAVVASSGTALTTEQLTLLGRFTDTVLICFDADPAGESAAKRGIDLALLRGMNVKVIRLPAGVKDPDELVAKDPPAWKRVIVEATDVMTYYFEKIFALGAPASAADKKRVGAILLPEIARLQNPIERSHWLHELSARLGVTETILEETIGKLRKGTENLEVERGRFGAGREQRTGERAPVAPQQHTDRRTKLAEAILAMFIAHEAIHDEIIKAISSEDLPHSHRELYLLLVREYHTFQEVNTGENAEPSGFFATVRNKISQEKAEFITLFDRLTLQGERWYREKNEQEVRQEFTQLARGIREVAAHDRRGTLAQAVRNAEKSGDHDEVVDLMKQLIN